jgi:hypothetical protein
MLESNVFAIPLLAGSLKSKSGRAIKNAETGELLGSVGERGSLFNRFLHRFLSKKLLPILVEVREKPDDSLVFTLRKRASIFLARIEVRDAMDGSVGYFTSKSSAGGGLRVYDKDGNIFAVLVGASPELDYRFVSEDGTKEFGHISRAVNTVNAQHHKIAPDTGELVLCVNAELTDQPLAKMLLLAAALALGMNWQRKCGRIGSR